MLRRSPYLDLALGVLILGGTISTAVARVAPGFTPFVPQALPQGAPGDFDGDGRPDVALIQDGVNGHHVSVRLSGSPGAVLLDAEVVGVIAADIDHDGDVDLVTAAPSGQVVNWLNDGRETGIFEILKPRAVLVWVQKDTPQWAAWVEYLRVKGRRPQTTRHRIEGDFQTGWMVESEWLPGFENVERVGAVQ